MQDPLCDTQGYANVCVCSSFPFSEWTALTGAFFSRNEEGRFFSIHKVVCGFFCGMKSNDRSFSFCVFKRAMFPDQEACEGGK